MGLFGRWFGNASKASPEVAPSSGQHEQPIAVAAPKIVKSRPNSFLDLVAQHDELEPEMATLTAYVAWLVAQGECGDWEQTQLFGDYEKLCIDNDLPRLGPRKFGAALIALGCRRKQADTVRKGKRARPYMIRIPKSLRPQVGNIVPWPELPQRATG